MVFFQLEDFALHVDRDLAREVAARDGGGHLGDVAHLSRQIGGEQVDVCRQVLPGAGHVGNHGLAPSRPSVRLAGDTVTSAANERSARPSYSCFLELEDLAAHIDGDFFDRVALGDRGGDLGDVANRPVRLLAMN